MSTRFDPARCPPVQGMLLTFGLACAAAVPILYFGAQALAASAFPGFDLLRHTASQLGSDLSARPGLLNDGAIATGMAACLGGIALAIALVGRGGSRIGAACIALALASTGAAAIWAGTHPLPDPRHNPGALGAGLFLLPLLVAVVSWRIVPGQGMRRYFVANLAAFAALATVLGGLTPIDPTQWPGLWQRLLALVVHGPSAVLATAWLVEVPRRPA